MTPRPSHPPVLGAPRRLGLPEPRPSLSHSRSPVSFPESKADLCHCRAARNPRLSGWTSASSPCLPEPSEHPQHARVALLASSGDSPPPFLSSSYTSLPPEPSSFLSRLPSPGLLPLPRTFLPSFFPGPLSLSLRISARGELPCGSTPHPSPDKGGSPFPYYICLPSPALSLIAWLVFAT